MTSRTMPSSKWLRARLSMRMVLSSAQVKSRDHRGVIRRLFPTARDLVDIAGDAVFSQGIGQQDMVNAQPGIATVGKTTVIPPREGFFGLRKQTECIGQTQVEQGL